MSALTSPRLRLKGHGFDAHICVGDLKTTGDVMDHYTPPTISPTEYKFPDVHHYSSVSVSPPSSPSDSPSTSTSALPSSANSSSLSLHPVFPAPPVCPSSPSLRDLHLPILTPEEILDTLDHLAANAPKKKSHARKQPVGHIPRPRNAFILFRCLFVSQQAVPASVEKDHRNISRIAGKVWKSMSETERDPWLKAAELEKSRHEVKWPGYRYNPIQSQALPRRFTPGAPKSLVAGGHESLKQRSGRSRQPKREAADDDEFCFEPPFVLQQPISRYARVGSDSPAREREGKCAQLAHLVREGKKGPELEAALRGYPQQPDPAFQMRMFTPMFAMPTPTPAYEMSLPPDSPPPTPTHIRLATRRSSSCPPLPPVSFPFSNPNPWSPPQSASGFTWPFPADSPFAFPPPLVRPEREEEYEDEHEHRPLTAPEHYEMTPRLGRDTFRDMSRLSHRRGSSLDRAIASSSIAGAFGGLPLPMPRPHNTWQPDFSAFSHNVEAQRHFSGHHDVASGNFTGPSSSGTGTPALSPSPQSSFEGSFDSGFYDSSHAEVTFMNGDTQSRPVYKRAGSDTEQSPREEEDQVMVYSPAPESEKPAEEASQEFLLSPPAPPFVPSGSMSPPGSPIESFAPRTKVPARLFGSQGARLGLDLDLDVPLSLDVSFNAPPSSASAPYSSQNPTSAVSCDSDPSPYPYTPSSPPDLDPTLVNAESSLAPRYNYSYTQALMDTDPDVGADEFRNDACVPAPRAKSSPVHVSLSP